MSEFTPFFVDRAKGGRAACKGCKGQCLSGDLRMAKVVPSPYGDNQQMKSWHHIDCFINSLLKQRPTTKRIDSIDDIGNWENVSKDDQEFLIKKINEMEKLYAQKNSGKYTAKIIKNESGRAQNSTVSTSSKDNNLSPESLSKEKHKTEDNMFVMFYKLCKKIAKVDAYTEKTAVVNNFFRKGSDGSAFKGDLALWCKLLLPQVSKRVYNLKSKQLVKLFSRIFNTDHDDMLTHLEQGDIADTIQHFFSKSKTYQPKTQSNLTIHDIDDFLENLSKLTKEDEQIYHFKKIVKNCTSEDMLMLIRLIKGDLRINTGPKHILEGVHPDAYNVFQTSRDLNMVLDRIMSQSSGVNAKDITQKTVKAELNLMTPVLPMLAEACKSIEMAMKKCPNGMFSEIKYDGERVQVHKKGNEFKYFSRALKPVMAHKVSHFKDYLPQAFPKGVDLILDAEVLMVDVNTGKPLPFGTLGKHKQSEFKDAQVCLFIFDCLHYNGKVLMDLPIRKRREILHKNMVEVTNHIMFSEQQLIETPADLAKMIAEVLQLGLEGLVLKDLESIYEPGKRHWLKVKKDYLFDGAMADTADLVVLGAWFGGEELGATTSLEVALLSFSRLFIATGRDGVVLFQRPPIPPAKKGTGKKGGMMSVFLMGCLDNNRNRWVTVTKVHTGHDDSTLERLQKELGPLMIKISQDYSKVPSWMDCNKGLVPDFVASDPKKQPVWEITGTEFTKANIHTADGISVRFPRVTRIRNDKDWKTATNLDELKHLFKTSKEKTDVTLLNKLAATASKDDSTKKEKNKSKTPKIDTFLTKPTSKRKDKDELDRSNENINSKIERKLKKGKKEDISNSSDSTNESKLKQGKKNIDLNTSSSSDNSNEGNAKKKPKIDLDTSNSSETSSNESKSKKRKDKDLNMSNSSDTIIKDNTSFDDSEVEDEIQLFPKSPLPDVFLDKKLGFYPDFISIPENERSHFERHWIAYGGIIVKSMRSTDVDYLVHNNNVAQFKKMQKLINKLPSHVRHVTKDWLIKCINDVKLYDTNKYAVTVEPS